MENNLNREFDWNDEIENESEYTLLPEGDYDFTVVSFERGRYAGSTNLPPCNKAILTIRVESPQGKTTLKHNLFLHTKTEGLLSEFFIAIGQKKHGEKLRMNWNAVTGARGRCKVYVDKWTGNDGTEHESNKIKRFLEPAKATGTPAAPTQRAFTPGSF